MKKDRISSQARIDANNRYRVKKYDSISFAVHKGNKEYYQNKAKELGYDSFTKFIVAAMDEKIERG